MTTAEKRIYTYILKFRDKHGRVPSTTELAKHYGVSRQRMSQRCIKLISLGYLKKRESIADYEVVDK